LNLVASDQITPAIRRWKPYPGYKHSGVEWLGTIPEHWNGSPLKPLAPTVQRGKSPDYVEEGGIPVINQACIYWEGLRLENVKYDSGKDRNDGKGRLFPGDVLVNSTGTGTLGRASVFRHEETHLADGHVTVVRVDQTAELPEYFFYLLQTPIYQGFIYAALVSGSTNQIELSRESFRATPTIVPPINEQARIVRFLDRETAKIDALVAKKERLIELLQEKRAALITRAVTKGFDPNVPMKDSDIEWLGEIPAHWEVRRIKFFTTYVTSGSRGWAEYYSDDGAIFLRIGNLTRTGIDLDLTDVQRVTPPSGAEGERTRVRANDVLISITAYIGSVAVVDDKLDAYVNQHHRFDTPGFRSCLSKVDRVLFPVCDWKEPVSAVALRRNEGWSRS
jgi:type I restriction enzyme, S subunit